MLKILVGLLIVLAHSHGAAAAEVYVCSIQHFNATTGDEIKTETQTIDFQNFSTSCQNGPCKSEMYLSGGDNGDLFSFSLVAHNAKPPDVAVMIMSFRLDSKTPYEGSSLAGTDYGNRLYTQVNASNLDIFIECKFSRN